MKATWQTRRGDISFPAYIPEWHVEHSGDLDWRLQWYLPRLCQAVLTDTTEVEEATSALNLPLLLRPPLVAGITGALARAGRTLVVVTHDDQEMVIDPFSVLDAQERRAEIAMSVPVPILDSGCATGEYAARQEATIANAKWARDNRRRHDLRLLAGVEGWDEASLCTCAEAYGDKCGIADCLQLARLKTPDYRTVFAIRMSRRAIVLLIIA